MKCLSSYGLPKRKLKEIFVNQGAAAPASPATLKKAGDACWKSTEIRGTKGMFPTAVERIDHCMVTRGVKLTNGGSPLADLLLLDMHSNNVRSTLHFCLRT